MEFINRAPYALRSRDQCMEPNTLVLRYSTSCPHCRTADRAFHNGLLRSMMDTLGITHFVTINVADPRQNELGKACGFKHSGGVPMFYVRNAYNEVKGPYMGTEYLNPLRLREALEGGGHRSRTSTSVMPAPLYIDPSEMMKSMLRGGYTRWYKRRSRSKSRL